MEGDLECPETGRKFPINSGIPNMLLKEDEVWTVEEEEVCAWRMRDKWLWFCQNDVNIEEKRIKQAKFLFCNTYKTIFYDWTQTPDGRHHWIPNWFQHGFQVIPSEWIQDSYFVRINKSCCFDRISNQWWYYKYKLEINNQQGNLVIMISTKIVKQFLPNCTTNEYYTHLYIYI